MWKYGDIKVEVQVRTIDALAKEADRLLTEEEEGGGRGEEGDR